MRRDQPLEHKNAFLTLILLQRFRGARGGPISTIYAGHSAGVEAQDMICLEVSIFAETMRVTFNFSGVFA